MRIACFVAAALVLASCGKKTLTLPEDPIDRAASCGVVAAIESRAATTDVRAPLPFDAQGHILHYALLGGLDGDQYSAEKAAAVNQRMSVLQKKIIAGKWRKLLPECKAAFPDAQSDAVTLPSDPLDAKLGCDELGAFVGKAMKNQLADYANELAEYREMNRKLDQSAMPAGLNARAGSDLEAQQKARAKAFAKIIPAGSPMAVMRQCIKRYG